MKRERFTLIELLMVVAVIGILVSMLMPSLATAREKTKRAVCISNQKQIGVALISYENDKERLPPGNPIFNAGVGIDSTIFITQNLYMGLAMLKNGGYLSGGKVFYCPTWSHPTIQFGKVDVAHGGWAVDEVNGPWPTTHVGISYHYRSTFWNPATGLYRNSGKSEEVNPAETAINADMWSNRLGVLFGLAYGHKDAYMTLFFDGHVKIVHDPKSQTLTALQPVTNNHVWAAQDQIWRNFFQK